MKTSETITLALAATLALARIAHADVRHLPPAEAAEDEELILHAELDAAQRAAGALVLHYRGIGAPSWRERPFRRMEPATYVAAVPADELAPPGIEYYITAEGGAAPTTAFASANAPHQVWVYESERTRRMRRDLDRHDGRRASARLAVENVDFGARSVGDRRIDDRYLRVDADFSYRIYSYPLQAIRFGYTRLLGETPDTTRADPDECASPDCRVEAGFKVGGWFELRLAVVDGVELDARGMVLATGEGFNVGGRGELRVGMEEATHLALGTELVADVGSAAFVRLGWGTVPRFPMAATVEITDFPASRRASAVRLLYDVAHAFPNGLRLGLRLGYQARDQQVGGLTLGANSTLEF